LNYTREAANYRQLPGADFLARPPGWGNRQIPGPGEAAGFGNFWHAALTQ